MHFIFYNFSKRYSENDEEAEMVIDCLTSSDFSEDLKTT
jgi:hypothetical protein